MAFILMEEHLNSSFDSKYDVLFEFGDEFPTAMYVLSRILSATADCLVEFYTYVRLPRQQTVCL